MDTRIAALLVAATACTQAPSETPATPDAAVRLDAVPASLRAAPMSWLVVDDRSSSWQRHPERRSGMRAGLTGFLTSAPVSLELAATSFPHFEGAEVDCHAARYATTDPTWPASAAALDTHLAGEPTTGGSPLGPALSGAGVAALQRQTVVPDHELAIVLLTDATPFDDEACFDSGWDQVASLAGTIFARGAGPHVHVVSVIGRAVSDDHFGRLDAIAAAGGGFAAFVNGSADDVARGTRDALTVMAERATCTRLLDGARPDFLTVAFDDGTSTLAHRVADATACEPEAFYVDDPASPTKATLCSGRAGIGGFCELTYLRARIAGPPSITPVHPF